MGVFQISITKIHDEVERMQVDVLGSKSPPGDPEDLSGKDINEKLASFQLLQYRSYLLNVFQAPLFPPGKTDLGKLESSELTYSSKDEHVEKSKRSGDKILEMLHFAGEVSGPKVSSRQDVNTTLTSRSGVAVPDFLKTPSKDNKEPATDPILTKDYGIPLRTVIINLEDWKANQVFSFTVNCGTEQKDPSDSQILLIPFDEGGMREKSKADTDVKTDKTEEKQEIPSGTHSLLSNDNRKGGNLENCPVKMQILVSNSLLITVQGSQGKLYAQELNNNDDENEGSIVASTKALLEQRKFTDVSENALTDEGIPLVPTKKEIIQELIRERLCGLGMDYNECGAFLGSRDVDFVSHRTLSVKLPSTNRSDSTPADPCVTLSSEPGAQFSASFEVQARYQTLLHHSTMLNKILNSAAVSVIESSIFYILPHLTLTAMGRKLNHLGPSLVDDWLEVIYTAAYQLKPSDPGQVSVLVEREMKQINKSAELFLKTAKKTLLKVRKLNDVAVSKYRKANLPKYQEIKKPSNSSFPVQKADVGYSSYLQKLGVSASNLYSNHIYMSVGKYGLLLKKHLRDSWFQFDSLSYPERRVIFLGLMEHMQETLKSVTTVVQHIQELQVNGYPANVHNHLKVVIQLTADLTTSYNLPDNVSAAVLKQSRGIMQSFSRLEAVVKELYAMAKVSHGKFHASYYDIDDAQRFKLKKIDQKAARVQLVIPFSYVALEGLTALKYRGENPLEGKPRSTRCRKPSEVCEVPAEKKGLF